MTVQVDLSKYLEKEYEIEYEGQVYKLKPVKAWVLASKKATKGVVIGLFKLPDGRTIRKAIDRVEIKQ